MICKCMTWLWQALHVALLVLLFWLLARLVCDPDPLPAQYAAPSSVAEAVLPPPCKKNVSIYLAKT